MTTLLADLGGTHLRLATADRPAAIEKFKIADYPSIAVVIAQFLKNHQLGQPEKLALASAITPRNGKIDDCRFKDESHWTIDLDQLKTGLGIKDLIVLNDLEAATYALPTLGLDHLINLWAPSQEQFYFDHPPKLLVGIGTGIGHAFLFERPGQKPFVQRTHGGHVPAFGKTPYQQKIVSDLRDLNKKGRDLIMEDIVSGYGLTNLRAIVSEQEALHLFWEFLGLYCMTLTGLAGSYGGLYLTGGVVDQMVLEGEADMKSFSEFFIPSLVPVVVESQSSVPVFYCKEPNMAIAGLAAYAGSLE